MRRKPAYQCLVSSTDSRLCVKALWAKSGCPQALWEANSVILDYSEQQVSLSWWYSDLFQNQPITNGERAIDTGSMLVMFSLVLSPPPQLSLIAVQITLRSLCENDHMMYATVYVTHANSSKKKIFSLVPVGTRQELLCSNRYTHLQYWLIARRKQW